MPIKKIMIFSVAFVTTTLLCLSCQKDGSDSWEDMSTLQNTWWDNYYVRTVEYGPDGEIVRVVEMPEGYVFPTSRYIGYDFVGEIAKNQVPSNPQPDKWIYSERPYEYNSATRQLKIGDSIYDVLLLSSNRIELKFSYVDSANVPKESYYVWESTTTDKTWDEWVEYMDEENRLSRDFIASQPPARVPIYFEVRVQDSNGVDLLNSLNEGAVDLEKFVVRFNGAEYKVDTSTTLADLMWNNNKPAFGLCYSKSLEYYYLYVGTWSQYEITEGTSVQLDWGDGNTTELAFANSFVFDEEQRFNMEANYGYTFTRSYYYNGNVVDGVVGYENGCAITIVK